MKLGQIEQHSNSLLGHKDCFHVACVLVESDEENPVRPGQPVRFTGNSFTKVRPALPGELYHAIVDPFYYDSPKPDTLFWVMVRPGLASAPTHDYKLNITDVAKGEWSCQLCSD